MKTRGSSEMDGLGPGKGKRGREEGHRGGRDRKEEH